MPYKVSKLQEDSRTNTCGFFLPNGFYYVVEMTFENHEQLRNMAYVPGYSVDYVEGPVGMFTNGGDQVNEGSVRANFSRKTKTVAKVDPITRESKYRGKVTRTPVNFKHVSEEREEMLALALRNSIEGRFLSTSKIKDLLQAKGQRVDRTLGVA